MLRSYILYSFFKLLRTFRIISKDIYREKRLLFKQQHFSFKSKNIIWENTEKKVENYNGFNRVAIFASFSKKAIIEDYVVYYLTELKKVCDAIIFCSDNPLIESELQKIKDLVIYIEASKHYEYDFGSYKRGFKYAINNGILTNTTELIFCNDSCYGPISPLENIFADMEKKELDFYGMTSIVMNKNYYLPTYFVVLTRKVFLSDVFIKYIESIKKESCKQDFINNYEISFTQKLKEAGFSCSSFIPFEPQTNKYPYMYSYDLTSFPVFLLKQKCPLIKRRALKKVKYVGETKKDVLKYVKNINMNIYKLIKKDYSFFKF